MRLWLVVLAGCYTQQPAPRQDPLVLHPITERRVEAGVAQQAAGDPQYCVRAADGCWDCVAMRFPDEVPCGAPCSGGICVARGGRTRCVASEHACCASGPCETPPVVAGACDPECGDRTGDGKNDRCLIPASCPYKKQLADFFGHYKVQPSPALFEALCGPLPTTFPDDNGDGARVSCGPANVAWMIHPYTMSRGASASGPGVCYGKVRVASVGGTVKRCGKFHCQTLRYCDGREKPEYCTVIADCDDGRVVGTGLSW